MGILNIDLNIINLDNNFDNVLIPPPHWILLGTITVMKISQG